MRIRRLHIADFGIFRNQTLENLGPGIVLIGGPNRAGKTSFMQILRYLGYGFPRGGNFPPATHTYHVEADVVFHGSLYSLKLSGHARPQVGGSGRLPSVEELYNGLDEFSYRQLYTISLDELRRIPEGVVGNEAQKLQSVLLGAGLADVACLPQIRAELEKEAHRIGGKNGNPSVYQFKPYYEAIMRGLQKREKALGQVDLYREKQEALKKINEFLQDAQKELKAAEDEKSILAVLQQNYADYQRLRELDSVLGKPEVQDLLAGYPADLREKAVTLRAQYREAQKAFEDKLHLFQQLISDSRYNEKKRALLSCGSRLDTAARRLSGLREKLKVYAEQLGQYYRDAAQLRSDMAAVDESWQDFSRVEEIPIDQIEKDRLVRTLEEYEILSRAVAIRRQVEEIKVSTPAAQLRLYFLLAAGVSALGTGLMFWQLALGAVVGVTGVVGLGLCLMYRALMQGEQRARQQHLLDQLEFLIQKLGKQDISAAALDKQLRETVSLLQGYRRLLGVEEDASSRFLLQRLEAVQDLKRRIRTLRQQETNLREGEKELVRELAELQQLVVEAGYSSSVVTRPAPFRNSGKKDGLIDHFEEILATIEQASDHLTYARELHAAEERYYRVKQAVAALLKQYPECWEIAGGDKQNPERALDYLRALDYFIQQGGKYEEYVAWTREREAICRRIVHSFTSRAMAAFARCSMNEVAATQNTQAPPLPASQPAQTAPLALVSPLAQVAREEKTDSNWYLQVLDILCQQYASGEEVTAALQATERKIAGLQSRVEELQKKKVNLERDMEELSTDTVLASAQAEIDEARSQLEPLAVRYAIYKVAALILKTTHRRFMEKAEDVLLKQASRLLQILTSGEYMQIVPPDDLTEPDFQLIARAGEKVDSTEFLSRGTREQLFLAVRLSRVLEIQPPLPVIVDDSLVNFDTHHRRQAAGIIHTLARTHQVFVLTCHPEIVQYIGEVREDTDIQCWQLENGRFSPSSLSKLISFLS